MEGSVSKKSIYLQLLARFAVGLSVVFMPELVASESVHWAYSGEHGPAHWAELSSDYTTCGDGVHQSPIDIVKPVVAALQPLRYEYHSRGTSIVNNGHTLQINAEPGSRLIAEGEPFTEKNLGVKRPGGGASPMEYWSRLGREASRGYAADEQVDP